MKRHVVDGAEILRATPDIPALAPVVAFEHHLRLDGTGYPDQVKRASLNLGTMLCSIADVYDAMRSQRAYQQAFPKRSHSRGAEAQRRPAVRSAPRAAVRPTHRHLPGRQPRAARHRRDRRRRHGLRARSAQAAGEGHRRSRGRRTLERSVPERISGRATRSRASRAARRRTDRSGDTSASTR